MRKRCCGSCGVEMARAAHAIASIALVIVAAASCTTRTSGEAHAPRTPTPPLASFSEGKALVIGVDVRAARLAGPSEFLPLQVIVADNGKRPLRLDRESFVLERPDGVRLPVCTVRELRHDYGRSLADAHLGSAFVETIAGRFPEPPFHWQPLDFFPLRTEATTPRDGIDLRFGDVAIGYIYFRQPDLAPRAVHGAYKLLVKPGGDAATYVVDLIPYDLR